MLKTKINEFLTNKSIVILGFGREGKSTYKYIQDNNIKYTKLGIADRSEDIAKLDGVEYYLGEDYLNCIKDFDVIIKAPGISLKDIDISKVKDKIISQTELFIRFGREKIIGVTGTKGKSTTTSMIYEMLKTKYNVEIVGNIGLPALDYVDKFESTDYFIYELSSHQLELVDVSPKIAVFLNLYEEHLDYYISFYAYANAKRNIYIHQKEDDVLVYNQDMVDKLLTIPGISKKIGISQAQAEKSDLNLGNILGVHNIYNLSVAEAVARLLNVGKQDIQEAIKNYHTLPHRLEKIGEYGDVTFIDDSISTIPEATIKAMSSIEDIDTVLIGGLDRGVNYDNLADYLSNTRTPNIILMYESGKKIYEKMLKMVTNNNVIYAEDLEKSVELAVKLTRKNKICLLSPAAASYGMFKNFEERGDKFKEYVEKYSEK